jgi:replicative DNA helicase
VSEIGFENHIEVERSLIRLLLSHCSDPTQLDIASSVISQSDVFADPMNRAVYESIVQLHEQDRPFDPIHVSETFRQLPTEQREILTAYTNLLLSESAPVTSSMALAKRVVEQSLIRRIAHIGESIHRFRSIDDAFLQLDSEFHRISERLKELRQPTSLMALSELYTQPDSVSDERTFYFPSPFDYFNSFINGVFPSDLITIASLPGEGKTSLACVLALKLAYTSNKAVYFLTLGENQGVLGKRMLTAVSGESSTKLWGGSYEPDQLRSLLQNRLSGFERVFIDEKFTQSIFEMRRTLKALKSKYGLAAIFIDYVQLLDLRDRNKPSQDASDNDSDHKTHSREENISRSIELLKMVAYEMDAPLFLISQLDRRKPAGEYWEPTASDLSDAAILEEQSDAVFILFDIHGSMKIHGRQVRLKLAKNRRGPVGELNLVFAPQFTKFLGAKQT